MWFDLAVPVVIAHRGDSVHDPENTLAAFELAVRDGAEAIEFDVKCTLDGQVVVIHDQTVDRTTNGSGRVTRMTLAAVRDLDAGYKFSEQHRGEGIPTLEEVFATAGRHLHMNVELSNYLTPFDDLVPKVVELVKRHNVRDRILFSSFFPGNLKQAQALLPGTPCGLLTRPGWIGLWGRTVGWRGRVQALHPHFTNVNSNLVDRVHARGKRVNAWTVNGEADLRRMIGLEVDGLITDDPALACRLLGRVK